MDVFDLNQALVGTYSTFARSFTKLRSEPLKQQVDQIYATRRYWPEPLVEPPRVFRRLLIVRGWSYDDEDPKTPVHP